MTTFVSLLLSLVMVLLCLAIPWGARQIKSWQILVVFCICFALWVLGAALSLAWYPWTNIVVFLAGVGAGVLLGRVIPAKFWPFFIFLLIMSALDVTQIVLSTHGSSSASQNTSISVGELYANFFLLFPWGPYNIGPFDLLIFAAVGTYWRRLNGSFLVAFVGLALGVIVAYAILIVRPGTVLPLIPFLTAGWLCSVGIARLGSRTKAREAPVQSKSVS